LPPLPLTRRVNGAFRLRAFRPKGYVGLLFSDAPLLPGGAVLLNKTVPPQFLNFL
jgi:hypothetical protein